MNGNEQEVVLTITLKQNGGVEVRGPIHNKILCYGLLSAAQDAIRDFKPVEEPRISLISLAVAERFKGVKNN